ncbi:unnamed protein product, partial [Amoebophrya sp. A120]
NEIPWRLTQQGREGWRRVAALLVPTWSAARSVPRVTRRPAGPPVRVTSFGRFAGKMSETGERAPLQGVGCVP